MPEYLWEFGDDNEPSMAHVYEQAGVYEIGVRLTDSNGETEETEMAIVVVDEVST